MHPLQLVSPNLPWKARLLRLLVAGALLTGLVLMAIPFQIAQAVTITVNTTDDENNQDGDCSLREAIIAANLNQAVDACPAGSGFDILVLPAGTYLFSLSGIDNTAEAGDLDITESLSIEGAGPFTTIIDANGLDRVFEILNGSQVEMSRLTISGGDSGSSSGGGIRLIGQLTLDRVRVMNNAGGAGIYTINGSTLDLRTSRIEGNDNGGLYLQTGVTTHITNSSISSNTSPSGGGGISNSGTLYITNSTLSGNVTVGDGGGILSSGTVELSNVTLSNNTAGTSGTFGDGGGVALTAAA
jgi:CSLREA domain-containing protein